MGKSNRLWPIFAGRYGTEKRSEAQQFINLVTLKRTMWPAWVNGNPSDVNDKLIMPRNLTYVLPQRNTVVFRLSQKKLTHAQETHSNRRF